MLSASYITASLHADEIPMWKCGKQPCCTGRKDLHSYHQGWEIVAERIQAGRCPLSPSSLCAFHLCHMPYYIPAHLDFCVPVSLRQLPGHRKVMLPLHDSPLLIHDDLIDSVLRSGLKCLRGRAQILPPGHCLPTWREISCGAAEWLSTLVISGPWELPHLTWGSRHRPGTSQLSEYL